MLKAELCPAKLGWTNEKSCTLSGTQLPPSPQGLQFGPLLFLTTRPHQLRWSLP